MQVGNITFSPYLLIDMNYDNMNEDIQISILYIIHYTYITNEYILS